MATTKQVIVQAKINGEVVFDDTVNGKKHQRPLIRECMIRIDTLGGEAIIRTQVVGARSWAVYRYTAGSNHAEIDTAASWADTYNDPNFLDAARTVEAHHAYMLTMGFGLDGSNDYGLFNLKAGSPDEMVAKLSITVPNVYTHTMTVEFAPGSPDVVHIDLQPLDEVQITLDDE